MSWIKVVGIHACLLKYEIILSSGFPVFFSLWLLGDHNQFIIVQKDIYAHCCFVAWKPFNAYS
jgi:hypothetical protein